MAAVRLASEHDPVPTKPHVKPLALLPIADGCDELEIMTLYDVLTRAGVHVVTATVGQKKMNMIEAAYGMKIRGQKTIEDSVYERYDLIVLPGGIGASKLRDCDLLARMLKLQKQEQRWYAAIDTAPSTVFITHDLLPAHATCHPSKVRFMNEHFINEEVVLMGRCVTSQGPGTAMAFSLKLVEVLCGPEQANKVAQQVLVPFPMP
ncbi:hypothetical protein Poli38472_006851 [Pythium oligandrum]|uniref:DJ-1/PfpI domain-containing protein n=1 Tax=Pythium oligandrum TaxID=41045 RepID=A0A8K1C5B5_PYTOL|nr:hypothetical protein Poli38472_006851 [Pythium oligandrum]|eukprot:TMW56841.1 hypothetical protein Poli38472_006851 [Pythium oligandrum]